MARTESPPTLPTNAGEPVAITVDFLVQFCLIYGIRPEWLRPAPAGETPAPPPPAR